MKIKIIGVVGLLVLIVIGSVFVVNSSSSYICQSNVTLIDESYYREGMDNKAFFDSEIKEFSKLPEWLPSNAREMFERAQALPVNASDRQVKNIFFESPTESMLRGLKSFQLETVEDGISYLFKINKYQGCVSSATLTSAPKSLVDNIFPIIVVKTEFIIPTGVAIQARNIVDGCEMKRDAQKIKLTIDGVVPNHYSLSSDEYSVYLYKLFKSFNSRREKVYDAIGKADKSLNNQMSWNLLGDDKQEYRVDVKLDNNCETQLDIQWVNSKGENYAISKSSSYK